MKSRRATLAVLAAALLVAGCGSNDPTTSEGRVPAKPLLGGGYLGGGGRSDSTSIAVSDTGSTASTDTTAAQ